VCVCASACVRVCVCVRMRVCVYGARGSGGVAHIGVRVVEEYGVLDSVMNIPRSLLHYGYWLAPLAAALPSLACAWVQARPNACAVQVTRQSGEHHQKHTLRVVCQPRGSGDLRMTQRPQQTLNTFSEYCSSPRLSLAVHHAGRHDVGESVM
jgi:hypothetical protein